MSVQCPTWRLHSIQPKRFIFRWELRVGSPDYKNDPEAESLIYWNRDNDRVAATRYLECDTDPGSLGT
jgi:hypothetical protein